MADHEVQELETVGRTTATMYKNWKEEAGGVPDPLVAYHSG
jgi:hypothetical protein